MSAAEDKLRAAHYERVHLGVVRHRGRKGSTASDLRDAILRRLGPFDEAENRYDLEGLQLLDDFELALREAWETVELVEIRKRADEAIAQALGLPSQFRMPL